MAGGDPDVIYEWDPSRKRIMTTYLVARAIQRLIKEKPDLIAKSFLDCGLSVAKDGSEDHLIRIKDAPPGYFTFEGWQEAVNTTTPEVDEALEQKIAEVDKPLDKLVVAELKEVCKYLGVKHSKLKRKCEYITAIRAAEEKRAYCRSNDDDEIVEAVII
jgi:hypothetical protein